jgi:hypothetical protein
MRVPEVEEPMPGSFGFVRGRNGDTVSKRLVSTTFAIALLSTGFVHAQVMIDLNPQQRTIVWERLQASPTPPAAFEVGVSVAVPATVELHPVPADFEIEPLRRYRYVVIDNRMAFVDPNSRKIVHVIER